MVQGNRLGIRREAESVKAQHLAFIIPARLCRAACIAPILNTPTKREAKLQGKVTLEVLVGSDGRAAKIRVVQGIGLGLDERAEQAIRGWKFVPARDAARRAVPAWVTVEAFFRLF
jgi:TonB family protein